MSIRLIKYKTLLRTLTFVVSFLVYTPLFILIQAEVIENHRDNNHNFRIATESGITGLILNGSDKDSHDLISQYVSNLIDNKRIYSIEILDKNGDVILNKHNREYDSEESTSIVSKRVAVVAGNSNDRDKTVSPVGSLSEAEAVVIAYVVDDQVFKEDDFLAQPLFLAIFSSILNVAIVSVIFRNFTIKVDDAIEAIRRLSKQEKGIRLSEEGLITEVADYAVSFNSISAMFEKIWKEAEHKEQVYELKNRILQIAAHEIRNPIGSIKTFLDIAIHHNTEHRRNEVQATLRKCFSDVDALDHHVSSILSLSALENGSLARSDRWVNVREFFNDIDSRFSIRCKSKFVSWHCYESGYVADEVFIDYDLLSIILSNAIDNAVKYTEKGFVNVSFKVDTNMLMVSVHDSGVGLSNSDIDELRKASNQLENNVRRTKDGWGIGMSTMHKFADFLDGTIEIESKRDFGTKVSISIPVQCRGGSFDYTSCSTKELDLASQDATLGFNTTYVHNVVDGGLTVLIIDNDPQYLSQMEELFSPMFLKRSDVQVTYCSSASDAIRHVEDFQYDLILVDYHMPGMDGLQFLKFLDENDTECRNSKKIVVTADASIPEDVKQEMSSMAQILSKGLTSSDVRNLIRSVSLKSVS